MRRYLPFLTLTVAISALYFYRLNGFGVIGPDEPRYAAIGRSMAQNGDWITPKLWGSPWFEKPPLLYWLTAAGNSIGLGPELSGRLPVVLLGLIFLVAAFFLLRKEFGNEAAGLSSFLLATSAGWLAFSQLCLTDLPLSVFFSLAVFVALPMLHREVSMKEIYTRFAIIGACLGVGTLAKGLVPIALAIPFFWFFRRWWRNWWIAFSACVLVAGPWYVAVYKMNGYPFIEEFFLKHHLERLYSASLQHVQPWYYYFPVLLSGLFPWTPLMILLGVKPTCWDRRRRFLASISLFGLFFFSLSLNKLAGYILPLFPSMFALLGAQFEIRSFQRLNRIWFVYCACLIALIPFLATLLPQALKLGRLSWPLVEQSSRGFTRIEFFYVALPLAVVILARRSWLPVLLLLSLTANGIYLKEKSDPVLDESVSARAFWKKIKSVSGNTCEDWLGRDWLYGLQFYRGSAYPPCRASPNGFEFALRPNGHRQPTLHRLHPPSIKKAGEP